MEFSDKNLIYLVENCPNLYAKNRQDYKDRQKAQNSWESIGKTLNVTAADCERRWAQLRDRFSHERRMLKTGLPSGSGASKKLSPSDLYKNLSFLEPYVQIRRTRGNIQKRSVSPPDDLDSWKLVETLETDETEIAKYLKSMEEKENIVTVDELNEIRVEQDESIDIQLDPLAENNANNKTMNSSMNFRSLHKEESNKAKKFMKKVVSSEDAALEAVSEALSSVKGLCEASDKSDNVPYNFCITTYGQKKLSKKKQKLARARISAIMLELESDSE